MASVLKSLCYLTIFLLVDLFSAEKLKICYYTNWAQYRQGACKFLPENIDPTLCSHIYYAFAKINYQTLQIQGFEWNDDQMIPKVVDLKKVNPKLKVLISVGGWTHDLYQHRFSKMVTNATTRQIFIDSAITFMKKYDLDGLSYDWEWPANRGSPPSDKHKFTLLLQQTQSAFQADGIQRNTEPFILTIAVGAGPKVIETAYEIAEIAKYIDWAVLMTYDLHGSFENTTGCSTAMKGKLPTVPNSVDIFLNGGLPAAKTVLGLAAYGRTFQLASAKNNGLNASTYGPGSAGRCTQAMGTLAFYEICSTDWSSETTYIASAAGAPYASKGNQWVGYDTKSSIRNKIDTLVHGKDLAGFALWALDEDDFTGTNCNLGVYPLLKEAVNALSDVRYEKIKYHRKCRAKMNEYWRVDKELDEWCRRSCNLKIAKFCPQCVC